MAHLESLIANNSLPGKEFTSEGKKYVVDKADNFSYTDPIDNSFTKNQVSIVVPDVFVFLFD